MSLSRKPPEVEIESDVEFPLDAYTSTTLHVPKGEPPSDRFTLAQGSGRALFVLLLAWAAYNVAQHVTRTACFQYPGFVPILTPPVAICRLVYPTPTQFWQFVFSEDEPAAMEHQAHVHVSRIRQLLAIPRRPDFALRGLGASINPEFTSPTYTPPGQKPRSIDPFGTHSPSIVLEEQVLIGDCWEFLGSTGRIGIHLAERVNITALSVGYPDPKSLPSDFRMQAPRRITLWALIDGKSSMSGTASTEAHMIRRPHDLAFSPRLPSQFNTDSYFVPIIHAEYRLNAHKTLQTFILDVALDHVLQYRPSFVTQDVVIEVKSNWGGSTTCLHQIGIHGDVL